MGRGCTDRYELAMVLHHDTGETRVYRPILTEEEREIRFNRFKEAVARFLDAIEEGRTEHWPETADAGHRRREGG